MLFLRRRDLYPHLLPPICPRQTPRKQRVGLQQLTEAEQQRVSSAPACGCRPDLPRNRPSDSQRHCHLIVQRLEDGDPPRTTWGLEEIADQYRAELTSDPPQIVQKNWVYHRASCLLTLAFAAGEAPPHRTCLPVTISRFWPADFHLRALSTTVSLPLRPVARPVWRRRAQRRGVCTCSGDTSSRATAYRPPSDWEGILSFRRGASSRHRVGNADLLYARTVPWVTQRWIR